MNRVIVFCAYVLGLVCSPASAQIPPADMPTHLTIARHTFFDFGPPHDFYEILDVAPNGNALSVQRALVTPAGAACVQPAKIELSSGIVHENMEQLLQSKNPCAIPEKELRRERKRRKKCLVFSGVDVAMQVNCAGKNRQIHTAILDRDMFGSAPGTPKNTSWSMAVLQKLDSTLGPGVMDKPIFPVVTAEPKESVKSDLVDEILSGAFDPLFGPQVKVSAIAQDAVKGPPPPAAVQIESVSPFRPIAPELPKYPPIAKLVGLEGLVDVTFEVVEDGTVQDIAFVSGPRLRMLEQAVHECISKWSFPDSARGKSEKASIRFQLNCHTN